MLFEQRFWAPIAEGTVTVTFRRWRTRQAVAGRRYRIPSGFIEVDEVAVIEPADVTDADARAAGYPSAAELLTGLDRDAPLHRVRFHFAGTDDPRADLAADDALDDEAVATITRRLDRMDATSAAGAWTGPTLALIDRRPGVRAPDLATELGRETLELKRDVRKLKALGLTISLRVGYELSPRGRAYLDRGGRSVDRR